jgi:protease-4
LAYLNKGIRLSLTDKREIDPETNAPRHEVFFSQHGLSEFVEYLDNTREKLIEDKMGIHTDVVKTNDHSDFGGSYPLPLPVSNRALTPYERNVLQNYVNQGYETFLSRVMSGRGLTHDELHAIAQGRVWTGEDALKIGLVDVLGGLEDAIRIAAQKAGIEKYNLTEYPVVKSPIEELFAEFTTEVKARLLKEELGTFYTTWEQMKNKVENQGLLARIPYDIAFN